MAVNNFNHVLIRAGPVKSTVDYIIVRQEDKAKVRNVKVIPNEECVPKHKLNREDAMDRARWRKLIGMIDDYDESSG